MVAVGELGKGGQLGELKVGENGLFYVVNVDFGKGKGTPYGETEEKSKFVLSQDGETAASILFTYVNEEGAPPILLPADVPAIQELVSASAEDGPKPTLAKQFGIENDNVLFASIHQAGSILPSYIRHEAGYALMSQSQSERLQGKEHKDFRKALWNTGHILLLSVGVKWHLSGAEMRDAEKLYEDYYAGILGPIPRKSPSQRKNKEGFINGLGATGLRLKALNHRNVAEVYMTQGWDDMVEMGHGFPYMLRTLAQRNPSASINLITGPLRIDSDFGASPVAASWIILLVK